MTESLVLSGDPMFNNSDEKEISSLMAVPEGEITFEND